MATGPLAVKTVVPATKHPIMPRLLAATAKAPATAAPLRESTATCFGSNPCFKAPVRFCP